MKNSLFLLVGLVLFQLGYAQMATSKKFDYSTLDQKVLYIQEYDLDDDFVKRMTKRGKHEKLKDAIDDVESYNRAWEDAMNTSSFDASPYEIRGYDQKRLLKEKNNKAIILQFWHDHNTGNEGVSMVVTGPKKAVIAVTYITGLDIETASDLRLIMNLLNYSLQEAAELSNSGEKVKRSALVENYKKNLVEIYDRMPDMTFLLPDQEYGNPSKTAEKKRELKQAFKEYWTLSKYEFISQEELQLKRRNGEADSFYWQMITIFTTNALVTYRMNYLLTTEKDEPIFMFLGSKKFKPRTMEEIQTKLVKRAEKYSQ